MHGAIHLLSPNVFMTRCLIKHMDILYCVQPLLSNGRELGEITTVSRQLLGKHVPAATDTNATIEERCFLCGQCQEVITRIVGPISSIVGY
jgi:hypothetical protein